MSRYLVMGGSLGFIVAFASGIMVGHGLSTILRDAMIGCLIMAFIAKFFYQNLERSVTMILEKEIEELQQKVLNEQEAEAASKQKQTR